MLAQHYGYWVSSDPAMEVSETGEAFLRVTQTLWTAPNWILGCLGAVMLVCGVFSSIELNFLGPLVAACRAAYDWRRDLRPNKTVATYRPAAEVLRPGLVPAVAGMAVPRRGSAWKPPCRDENRVLDVPAAGRGACLRDADAATGLDGIDRRIGGAVGLRRSEISSAARDCKRRDRLARLARAEVHHGPITTTVATSVFADIVSGASVEAIKGLLEPCPTSTCELLSRGAHLREAVGDGRVCRSGHGSPWCS